jgi:prepilin-type processing-associated H-X9-DG protein
MAGRFRISLRHILGVAFLALVIWSIFSNHGDSMPEQAHRIQCANHLRQFGLAAIDYANHHGGRLPDNLQILYAHSGFPPSSLYCPDAKSILDDNAAPYTVAAAIAANQTSYTYLGRGLKADGPADTVLMVELLSDHEEGINVLYLDAHVEWFNADEARQLISQIATGPWPVRDPTSISASRP